MQLKEVTSFTIIINNVFEQFHDVQAYIVIRNLEDVLHGSTFAFPIYIQGEKDVYEHSVHGSRLPAGAKFYAKYDVVYLHTTTSNNLKWATALTINFVVRIEESQCSS